jgi:DNA-directed RNA polymerase subunit RPC12/RpoP
MPPKRITPTETKTCATCGKPFTRNRHPAGRLESHHEFARRQTCGTTCGSALTATKLTKHHTHAPCTHCGGPIERRETETRQAWRNRDICSIECLTARRVENAVKANKARAATKREHPPCRACGKPVERREGEGTYGWNQRLTCSTACASEMKRRAAIAQNTRTRVPPPRRAPGMFVPRVRSERPTPPAKVRVFRGFPTPAAIKSAWVPVTGGSLPPHEWNNSVTKSTPRPTNLRAALQAHPDLATALAGLLTDSWHPHAPTPPSYEGGTT